MIVMKKTKILFLLQVKKIICKKMICITGILIKKFKFIVF